MITPRKTVLNDRIVRAGFTRAGLARAANISKGYVTLVLSGKRRISPPIAKRICETLSCDFDDVFEIRDEVEREE